MSGYNRKIFSVQRGHIRLYASLEYPDKITDKKVPLVIFMHALMMDHREPIFDRIAEQLLQHGIAVLRFDFMGHGRSGGNFEDMTIPAELEDAREILEFAESLSFVSGISLLGHSQGGVIASMTAGAYPEKIQSLVLMAPAATLAEDARKGRIAGSRYQPDNIPSMISCFGMRVKGAYAKTAQELPIYEVSSKYRGPVCLIHGTTDFLVNARASEQYHRVYENSTLHLLDGVDHEFYRDMEQAVRLAVDFLSQNQ